MRVDQLVTGIQLASGRTKIWTMESDFINHFFHILIQIKWGYKSWGSKSGRAKKDESMDNTIIL